MYFLSKVSLYSSHSYTPTSIHPFLSQFLSKPLSPTPTTLSSHVEPYHISLSVTLHTSSTLVTVKLPWSLASSQSLHLLFRLLLLLPFSPAGSSAFAFMSPSPPSFYLFSTQNTNSPPSTQKGKKGLLIETNKRDKN